jgi:hypothetical protein
VAAAALAPSTVWAVGALVNTNNNGQMLTVRTTTG